MSYREPLLALLASLSLNVPSSAEEANVPEQSPVVSQQTVIDNVIKDIALRVQTEAALRPDIPLNELDSTSFRHLSTSVDMTLPNLPEFHDINTIIRRSSYSTFEVFLNDGRTPTSLLENLEIPIPINSRNVSRDDILNASSGVGLLTYKNNLSEIEQGTIKLKVRGRLTDPPFELCPEEKFASFLSGGHCSAFLIDDDLMLTAGHCAAPKGEYGIIFKYSGHENMASENVFLVLSGGVTHFSNLDIALLKLDREVPASLASPLNLRKQGTISAGEPVGIIGHPLGIMQIFEFGDESKVVDVLPTYFRTNNDAFDANSGSPIFNQTTMAVEGVLVDGQYDYYFDHKRACSKVRVVDAHGSSESGNPLGFQKAIYSEHIVNNLPLIFSQDQP